MNSGTSPISAQGGRALPAAAPNIPGNPRVALLAAAVLPVGKQQSPPFFRRLPLPSQGPGMDGLAGGSCGEEHGLGGRMEKGALGGCELWRDPGAVATAGSVAVGWWGGSRPSLRKPGKWVGGRGKVVTGSGEPRCSKAHTFKGILGYSLSGLHCPFLKGSP